MAEDNKHDEGQAAGGPADRDRKTRRRLLAAAAGALGVAAAEVVATAAPAQANNGDPVLQGHDNGYPTSRTAVFTSGQKEWAQLADPGNAGLGSLGIYAHGQDYGVYADVGGDSGIGVAGYGGTGAGVQSQDGTGVAGFGNPGVFGSAYPGGNGEGVAGNGTRRGRRGVR